MTEEIDETAAGAEAEAASVGMVSEEAAPAPEPRKPMPPPESRFLYVGVAAKRAKQLRRGAHPRLRELEPDPETGERPDPRGKLERVAMREVNDGLIAYEVPDPHPAGGDGA